MYSTACGRRIDDVSIFRWSSDEFSVVYGMRPDVQCATECALSSACGMGVVQCNISQMSLKIPAIYLELFWAAGTDKDRLKERKRGLDQPHKPDGEEQSVQECVSDEPLA